MGYGIRSISSTVCEMIDSTKENLSLTIYSVSDQVIIKRIRKALERGITVEVFIYYPEDPTFANSAKEITSLEERYSNLTIHKIRNEVLHAKVIVSDGMRVITGSANVTYAGMVTNYELALMLEDQEVAYQILTLLRKLVT